MLTAKEVAYEVTKALDDKKGMDIKAAQEYEREKKSLCAEKDLKPIREMLNRNYAPYLKYIKEKKISNRLYLDYLRACNYLGLDMSLDKNRYPHDFKRWHDIRIDEYNTKKMENDKKERAEFYAKFEAVASKYLPMQKDKNAAYLVIIPKSPAELQIEGRILGHCVGSMGYDQRFTREENLIFFLRNLSEIEKPFVTVEYSITSNTILQCYGSHNRKPSDEIRSYLDKDWLPYTKKQLKKIA